MSKKPAPAATPFPAETETLHQSSEWIWIPLRGEWRGVTTKPEELVRQKFIRHLIDHSHVRHY